MSLTIVIFKFLFVSFVSAQLKVMTLCRKMRRNAYNLEDQIQTMDREWNVTKEDEQVWVFGIGYTCSVVFLFYALS